MIIINNITCLRIFSMKIRGHPGLSGRRVRERVTAEPLINYEGAMRWLAVKVTTSDIRSATWRLEHNNSKTSLTKMKIIKLLICLLLNCFTAKNINCSLFPTTSYETTM